MPVITALEPDPHRQGAVRIAIDGRNWGSVAAALVTEEHLRPGCEVDPLLRSQLDQAADAEAALRAALRHLERRPFARADLGRRLARRGHPSLAVESALERAAALGALDDAEFARHFVATRAERGRGPARLARDLALLGVDRGLAERAIAERWPPGAAVEAIERLAARRSAQLGDLPRQVKRRRLLVYLARRGFRGPEALAAVARLA